MDDARRTRLSHWLYVSEITILITQRPSVIASIVEVAQSWNAEHGITGCLLASSRHFSQWVEGPPDALDVLRDKVMRDPRHRSILTVDEGPLVDRQFASWSLGYFGPSPYMNRVLARPLRAWPHDRERGSAQLCDLMRTLSRDRDLGQASG